MQTVSTLAVFVIDGKRKPVKTDLDLDPTKQLPATVEHDGGTYYLATVDLVDRTITYVAQAPTWH